MSSLVPEVSAAWSSRPALAGSHDGRTSAASFTVSRSRLISETPVLPGLTEVGADTVIVEAEDSVNGISLDLALQLTGNGLVRCRAGISNKNVADYRLEGLELFLPVSDLATHRVEFDGPALSTVPLRSGSWSVDHWGFDDRPAYVALAVAGAAFAAGRPGRCMWPSVAQSSIGLSERSMAGPISVVESSCRPAKSCSVSGRRITPRGWCGAGAMGWMLRRPACIGTFGRRRGMTSGSSSTLPHPRSLTTTGRRCSASPSTPRRSVSRRSYWTSSGARAPALTRTPTAQV